MSDFRLILDPPRSATLNMAIDELLMAQGANGGNLPTLRIYGWQKPSYSVGYFQDVAETAKKVNAHRIQASVVRRLTGGGLVFHDRDLTLSLVTRYPNRFFSNDTKTSYLKINEALGAGLRKLYPALDFADCKSLPRPHAGRPEICFESPACYDLMLQGRKVVGASQRRSRGVLLHQSTVFLPGGRPVLTGKILEGFREKWKVEFSELPLSKEEVDEAMKKERERYSSPEWAILA